MRGLQDYCLWSFEPSIPMVFAVAWRNLSVAFGPLVKKYRLAKGLSQEALAEKADVHPTYIGLLERRKRTPGIDVAERISNALGLKLSQFIAEAEKAPIA